VKQCQNCKFFERRKDLNESLGFCHRYPPNVLEEFALDEEPAAGQFPLMIDDDWCGEWKLKEPEIPAIEKETIRILGLSTRNNNCLSYSHIHTIGELIKKTEKELLQIRGLGRASLRQIIRELSNKNLFLKGDTK